MMISTHLLAAPYPITYSSESFSSSRPTILTKYPLAQKCLPQYRFLSARCLSKIMIVHFPFKKPIISDTANFGRIDMSKCIWFSRKFSSSSYRISSFSTHILSNDFLYLLLHCPFITPNRYLGHHTIWYLQPKLHVLILKIAH